jgi:type IV secretory pathway VirB4 component
VEEGPIENVVKKHSISAELAQKIGECSRWRKPENLALPRTLKATPFNPIFFAKTSTRNYAGCFPTVTGIAGSGKAMVLDPM